MSSANQVKIVDYGIGNRRSVEKAFERVGEPAKLTGDIQELRNARGVVVPGVGAFAAAMKNLQERELDAAIRERALAGVPVLGICLGMQLLFEQSSENELTDGLGLIKGKVEKLQANGLKLPHIGWNQVTFTRSSPLAKGLPKQCAFYHVHSYAAQPTAEEDVLAFGEYGQRFTSIIEHEHLFGVQFHPEKSSNNGLQLLKNFVEICSS